VPSYLPAGCVGAGDAAIAVPGRRVLALGTPASNLGASSYPAKDPIVRFLSATASGSPCKTAHVKLASVSLFAGVVTARSVSATHGRGSVSGLEIYGSPVRLRAGHPVSVGGWGTVTLDKTVGRITAPLVVQLLAAHHGLPAGTTIAFGFGAARQEVATPKHKSGSAHPTATTQRGSPRKHRRHKHRVPQPLTATPGLGYKSRHYVFPVDGGASYIDTYGANRSDVYDGWHHGDDLFAPLGTPVVAVARGKLSLVGWNRLGGWRLWLTDRKGNSFYYAHLAGYARGILKHRQVQAGQVVGFLGRTGDAFTTTPHLHFEIHPSMYDKLGYDGAVDPTRYLHLWRVVHVPKSEIPQPARLKAPKGAPRQEASVVWRQLLLARHIAPAESDVSDPGAGPSLLHRPFFHLPRYDTFGIAPRVGNIEGTAALVSASDRDMPLLVGGPLGGVLVLSAVGAFTFWRRRRTTSPAPPDVSS
jgi:murein DD-endopeptidase MepM/ murein hydrolase activator NlpD